MSSARLSESQTPGQERKRLFLAYLFGYLVLAFVVLGLLAYFATPFWIQYRTGTPSAIIYSLEGFWSMVQAVPLGVRVELIMGWSILGLVFLYLFQRRRKKWKEEEVAPPTIERFAWIFALGDPW